MAATLKVHKWLVSYPGFWWAGRKRAWYLLFAHALNFPEIFGNWKLYPYNRDVITYIYRYIVCTFTYQWWNSFVCSFSCALQLPPTTRYFLYESQKVASSLDVCLGKYVFIQLLPGKSVWYEVLLFVKAVSHQELITTLGGEVLVVV